MLRLATESDGTYAPPSNICPISGRDAVSVTVSPTLDAQDGTTYPITLPQTVYGGTVDVTNGVLTVTHGYKLFTGADSEGWTIGTGSNSGRVIAPVSDAVNTAERTAVLGNMVTDATGSDVGTGFLYNASFYYYYPSTMGSTVAEWKTYLASNNLQIVYPLATPIIAQLTPTEITTLLGTNNVWSDTGDITVEYCADTKRYIQKLISQLA